MSKRQLILLAGLVILSLSVFLLLSWQLQGIGFPLDDAWIHQTYARNFAEHGEWACSVGQPSGGSTAPLWSAILMIGVWLDLAPFPMTYLIGACLLFVQAVLGIRVWRELLPNKSSWAYAVGVGLIFEWHLVWTALSGMETLLHAVLITLILIWSILDLRRIFWLGVTIGVSVWVRPDAITLLGPILLIIFLREGEDLRRKCRQCIILLSGFGVLFGAYLLFNLQVAGSVWPNTFYAKQTEYAILQEIPLLYRWIDQFMMPLVGVGILLLPGVVYLAVQAINGRRLEIIAGMIWWVAYLGLYAWRLPVTYQHGRYIMPAMPIFFIWGSVGIGMWIRLKDTNRWRRIFSRVLLSALFLVLCVFWGMGARSYARDVAIINTEMIQTVQWIEEHTDQGSLIAAHDIGALGYFATHPLLDLAGLVSPEVIPFIRDEEQLYTYMVAEGADYLMTFPDWYPYLSSFGQVVFRSQGTFSPLSGGENMIVIELNTP